MGDMWKTCGRHGGDMGETWWATTICSLRKFTSAYYTKFQEKLFNSLLMINIKKNITEKEEEKQNLESI